MCLLGLAPFNRHWHVCTGAAGTGGIDGRMDVVRHIGADLILNCSEAGQLTADEWCSCPDRRRNRRDTVPAGTLAFL